MMSLKFKLHDDQKGIMTFVVTMLIMLILTLTTLAMATVARREQRATTDKLLSAEAYYTAESGINDTIEYLNSGGAATTHCSSASSISQSLFYNDNPVMLQKAKNVLGLIGGANFVLGGAQQTSEYTCDLVTKDPTSLEYSQVSGDNAAVADFTTTSPVHTLVIGWQDYQPNTQFRGGAGSGACGVLDTASNWKSAPMLQIDITDLTAGFHRQNLVDNTASYVLDPCTGGINTATFSPGAGNANNAAMIPGDCDQAAQHNRSSTAPLRCNVNISLNSGHLLIRIKATYGTARVSILGLNGASPLPLSGAQTVVDVTGKAEDVVQRLQARIGPLSPYIYAVETVNSVCKRLQTSPIGTNFDSSGIPGLDNEATKATIPTGSCVPGP